MACGRMTCVSECRLIRMKKKKRMVIKRTRIKSIMRT